MNDTGKSLPPWALAVAADAVKHVERVVAESEGFLVMLEPGSGMKCGQPLPPAEATGIDRLFGPECGAEAVLRFAAPAEACLCFQHVAAVSGGPVDISGLPRDVQRDIRRRLDGKARENSSPEVLKAPPPIA